MANKNCLEGLRCPGCTSYEPLRIGVTTVVEMHDDGTNYGTGNLEYTNHSFCQCVMCSFQGTVKDFRIDTQEYLNDNHCSL